jgi:hypothetical protein
MVSARNIIVSALGLTLFLALNQECFAASNSNSLLVMSKAGGNTSQFKERLRKRGLVIVKEVPCRTGRFSVFVVRPSSGTASVALQSLRASADEDLEGADRLFESRFQQCVPSINDPNYTSQWYLQDIKYSEARCLLDAFSKVQSEPRMTSIDSGIIPIGNELQAGKITQYNFVDPATGQPESPVDLVANHHGTATTSVSSATTNNAELIAGTGSHDKSMRITMCRISDGVTINTLDVIKAMVWCVDNQSLRGGPGVINLSINAAPPETYNYSSVVQGIAKQAAKQGDLFVNGAGNTDNLDASKPSKNFRVVMGLGQDGTRWRDLSSGRGSVYGAFKSAAPAENILFLQSNSSPFTGSNSGTSLSAPIWSGAIAMLMSFDPKLTAIKADKLLLKTATKTPDGYYKPNLYEAVIKGLKLKVNN